jgi:fatty-acyl-CoA synthase
MVELQFSVAMAGGVLNTINTRLDPETIAGIIDHAEPVALVLM